MIHYFRAAHTGIQIMLFLSRKPMTITPRRKVILRVMMYHDVFKPKLSP